MNSQRKNWTIFVFKIVFAMVWLLAASANAATYAYRNDTFAYDTPSASAVTVTWHNGTTGATNGAPACTDYPLGDDDWSDITFASATTPANNFTFTFAGTVYSGLRIYSNGMLAFGTDTSGQWRTYSNATLPYATSLGTYTTGCPGGALANVIVPYWTDIVAGTGNTTTGASIQYELLGTAPNRRLVISWVNVKLYNTTTRYNFQVDLFESPAGGINSNFKYQYTTGSSTGSAATVGVQLSTADYTLYSFNQAFIDPTAGSAILWYPANQLAGKGAEYRFDEFLWLGTAGEVKDTSGSGQNAVKVGAATNVANGKVCRAGSFTSNTSNTTIDAVQTPVTPGTVGSMDFWFNSNVKWNSANQMLFDATKTAANPFFLMKSSTGALTFSVTDSAAKVMTVSTAAQTFAASTWQHVGVSWNLRPGTNQTLLQVFLNGVLSNTLRTTSSGSMATTSTIFIGDNATSGITPTGGSPNGANGLIDEVNIYPTEINATQATADMNSTHTCTTVDHFHVITNGTGVTCDAAPITIEAHDSTHALIPLSGVTLTLSTSTGNGNWSNVTGGAVNVVTNNGNGSGTYVFSNESKIILGLQDPVVESTVIGAVSGSVTTTSGVASTCTSADYTFGTTCNTPLSFTQAGFIFSSTTGGAVTTIPTQTAGTSSSTFYLRAVKTSTTTQACVAALSGTTAINMGYACNNPSTCSAGNLMSINGGTSTAIASNSSGGTSNTTAVNMNFDANGNAPFTLNYGDAGQVSLFATRTISASQTLPLTGSSNQFVVAPASFGFTGITAGPIKAGSPFGATVTALTSGGATTPNFGKETSPEGATLSLTKYQPTGTGAVTGTSSLPLSAFTNGVATSTTLAYNEIGTIDLTATLSSGNYLASGKNVTGTTGTTGAVGRFIPHHFDTIVAQGCVAGSYTYSGQTFTAQILARNLAGTTTVNYDGSANTTPNFAKTITLSDANGTAGSFSPATIALTNFTQGQTPLITAPSPVSTAFTFTTTPTAPSTIKLRATDTDAVVSNNVAGITTDQEYVRSGRLRLSNAFGIATQPLNILAQTQYWTGSSWATNADDSCTVIPVASVALSNYRDGQGNAASWTTSVTTGTGFTPGIFASGKSTYTLKIPTPATFQGSVDMALNLGTGTADNSCLSTHPAMSAPANSFAYLRGQNGNCTAPADPSATGSFGIYTPESQKTVHVRELY